MVARIEELLYSWQNEKKGGKRRWMGAVQKILAFCAKLQQPRILGEERYAAAARERGGVLQWKKKKCNFFLQFSNMKFKQ